jgi:hypothetical protein
MEKINELFECAIGDAINQTYPSLYTKDDVVSLLSKLRTSVLYETADALSNANNASITEQRFQDFSESVTKALENSINRGNLDIYDTSSAEFSINYHNTIEIESIDFNTDALIDELSDILNDQFVGYFGELQINTEENEG